MLLAGILMTFSLVSGLRPWGVGPHPLNPFLLIGPILLAMGGVRVLAGSGKEASTGPRKASPVPARALVVGLVMVVVGIFPWAYTPLFFGGASNSSSGLLGTIIFLLIGLPGLAMAATGYALRKAGRSPEP